MKILSPRVHGYIDFVIIALFALAPTLFNFSDTPQTISYVLAGSYVALVLLTAYPFGLVKAIPFTVHGAIEFVAAFVLAALPWLAGFDIDDAARNFFLLMGLGAFATWLVTDYKAADIYRSEHGKPHQVSHA